MRKRNHRAARPTATYRNLEAKITGCDVTDSAGSRIEGSIRPWDTLRIKAVVYNNSQLSSEGDIWLLENGSTVKAKSYSIRSGGQQTVEFQWEPTELGHWHNSDTGELTIGIKTEVDEVDCTTLHVLGNEAECILDSDCSSGYVCNDNACEEEQDPENGDPDDDPDDPDKGSGLSRKQLLLAGGASLALAGYAYKNGALDQIDIG